MGWQRVQVWSQVSTPLAAALGEMMGPERTELCGKLRQELAPPWQIIGSVQYRHNSYNVYRRHSESRGTAISQYCLK